MSVKLGLLHHEKRVLMIIYESTRREVSGVLRKLKIGELSN
jgi:hypothetical protein